MTLVINLVAGPGAGKSTTAAGVFYELKQADVNCELVTEYAKDLVWGENLAQLGNQVYILGKQHNRLWRLQGKVDVVVTDCPLFLSVYYGDHMSDAYKALALELFDSMDNMTWYLQRVKKFNPAGRVQDEAKAKQIDRTLWSLLCEYDVPFDSIEANDGAALLIARKVLDRLGRRP